MEAKIRLLDQMRQVMRLKHMSLRTEEAYVSWVRRQPLPELGEIERAKRPRRIPTVFTSEETQDVLRRLNGAPRLMANLLYGAGLRLMECVRLRVKDVDFAYQQITVTHR